MLGTIAIASLLGLLFVVSVGCIVAITTQRAYGRESASRILEAVLRGEYRHASALFFLYGRYLPKKERAVIEQWLDDQYGRETAARRESNPDALRAP